MIKHIDYGQIHSNGLRTITKTKHKTITIFQGSAGFKFVLQMLGIEALTDCSRVFWDRVLERKTYGFDHKRPDVVESRRVWVMCFIVNQ